LKIIAWTANLYGCDACTGACPGKREGLVGSISSYITGEVLGDTSSPGQVNKIASWHDYAKIERVSMLIQEILEQLYQAVRSGKLRTHCLTKFSAK